MTIIGIAGGTGSGKTTVVKRIVEELPPHCVAVVPLDSYYNDTSDLTEEERRNINFDHPDAFDWKLLHKQISELRKGDTHTYEDQPRHCRYVRFQQHERYQRDRQREHHIPVCDVFQHTFRSSTEQHSEIERL